MTSERAARAARGCLRRARAGTPRRRARAAPGRAGVRRHAPRRRAAARPLPPDDADPPRGRGRLPRPRLRGRRRATRSRQSTTRSTRSRSLPGHVTRSPLHTLFLNGDVVLRTETSALADPRDGVEAAADLHGLDRPRLPPRRDRRRRTSRSSTSSRASPSTEGITLADLKGTLLHLCARSSARSGGSASGPTSSRSPSRRCELDVSCFICGGAGCRTCKHTGWIELGGSGHGRPERASQRRLDPEEWSGFAFGSGSSGSRMLRHGIAGYPPVLGERPARPEAVLMRVPLNWLREYVAVDMPPRGAGCAPGMSTCEVERDRRAASWTRTATSACSASAAWSRPESTRTPTGCSSAASTWARASRARSSAAPGTSARARRSRSRCPARCSRAA